MTCICMFMICIYIHYVYTYYIYINDMYMYNTYIIYDIWYVYIYIYKPQNVALGCQRPCNSMNNDLKCQECTRDLPKTHEIPEMEQKWSPGSPKRREGGSSCRPCDSTLCDQDGDKTENAKGVLTMKYSAKLWRLWYIYIYIYISM